MAVRNFQVTLGAAATQVSVQPILAKWVIFQNNAAAQMRLGAQATVSATAGLLLGPGGAANPLPVGPVSTTNLNSWWIFGTATQVLDVIYDDGAVS
jgi:hypothetical protein